MLRHHKKYVQQIHNISGGLKKICAKNVRNTHHIWPLPADVLVPRKDCTLTQQRQPANRVPKGLNTMYITGNAFVPTTPNTLILKNGYANNRKIPGKTGDFFI